MRIIGWEVKEIRWGNFSQYTFVMTCTMLYTGERLTIERVVKDDDEAREFARELTYYIDVANSAIENMQ